MYFSGVVLWYCTRFRLCAVFAYFYFVDFSRPSRYVSIVLTSSCVPCRTLFQQKVIGQEARKASPPWLLAITNCFDFRWCVIALRKQTLIPSWIDHFELELYDVLYDITSKLGQADQVRSSTYWHHVLFNISVSHYTSTKFISTDILSFRAQDKAERLSPVDPGLSRGVTDLYPSRGYTPRNVRDRSITRSSQS